MRRPAREESLINFQILALMCLIALSFATSLAVRSPGGRCSGVPAVAVQSFTCVFLASLLDAQ